ncbi:MAG: hypothetical protein Q9170_005073 [Blastenia crenularia]
MSHRRGSTYNPFEPISSYNQINLLTDDDTPEYSDDKVARLLRDFNSGNHRDMRAITDEQLSRNDACEGFNDDDDVVSGMVNSPYTINEACSQPRGDVHTERFAYSQQSQHPRRVPSPQQAPYPQQFLSLQESQPRQQTSKQRAKRAESSARKKDPETDSRKPGVTMVIDGVLHVEHRGDFQPAIYHQDLRRVMIEQAPPNRYDILPSHGVGELDVTSYFEPHRSWGFKKRDQRPELLFQFLASNTRKTAQPGLMMHRGRLVIDLENHPIKNWPMPFCFSSKIEPGRVEAICRLNGGVSKRDFRARMPPIVFNVKGERKDLINEGSIGMKKTRFRNQAGLLTWNPRDGSSERKRALVQCIPPEDMNRILATNSTRNFRDLNNLEIMYINKANKGQHEEKAGSKKLQEDERNKRNAAEDAKLSAFEPPNPDAWPYLDDIDDDVAAIARARQTLGLPPIEPELTMHFAQIEGGATPENESRRDNSRPSRPKSRESMAKRKRQVEGEDSEPSYDDDPMYGKRRCERTALEVWNAHASPHTFTASGYPDIGYEADDVLSDPSPTYDEIAQFMDYTARPSQLNFAQMDPSPDQYRGFGESAEPLDFMSSPYGQMIPPFDSFPVGSLSTYGVPPAAESHDMNHIWEVMEGMPTNFSCTSESFEVEHEPSIAPDEDTDPYSGQGATPNSSISEYCQGVSILKDQPSEDQRFRAPTNEHEESQIRRLIGFAHEDFRKIFGY